MFARWSGSTEAGPVDGRGCAMERFIMLAAGARGGAASWHGGHGPSSCSLGILGPPVRASWCGSGIERVLTATSPARPPSTQAVYRKLAEAQVFMS